MTISPDLGSGALGEQSRGAVLAGAAAWVAAVSAGTAALVAWARSMRTTGRPTGIKAPCAVGAYAAMNGRMQRPRASGVCFAPEMAFRKEPPHASAVAWLYGGRGC